MVLTVAGSHREGRVLAQVLCATKDDLQEAVRETGQEPEGIPGGGGT